MWNELRCFCRFSRTRKWLLWEALIALAVARIAMALLPFRRVAAWMGTPGTETPTVAAAADARIAREIGWAVGVLARRVPWDGRCLAQALAGTGMLRRRALEGTVSFGICHSETAELDAHAWLRFGSILVTGGPGHERFNAFSSFARRRR